MHTQDLSGDQWSLHAVGDIGHLPAAIRAQDAVPARVPGCVHTDLFRAGLIPHPTVGYGELEIQWIGETDWQYRRHFCAEAALLACERIDLAFDGLDTIASISLNGRPVGTAANMFCPHRFDVRPALHPGKNELAITFASPLRHIRAEEARLGARPVNGDWAPYIFIRKAACNLGWDFGPKVATSGVWQGLRLEGWSGVRLAGVRPLVRRDGERWTVDVHADLEWSGANALPPGTRLDATLADADQPIERASCELRLGQSRAVVRLEVENPRLWWPRGFGEQALYPLEIALQADTGSGGTAETWRGRIGFREVRLNTEPDAHGSRFQIEVNGRPIFCKGANWVPEGLFPDDRPPGKIRERIAQAAAANMNMLRVWGGGFYESDDFYGACDELGIMVWQDFMFACAMYPEEDPYPALVEAEARHQVARLSAHPSVVLWCGGNECVWAHESWGAGPGEKLWKDRLALGQSWGAGYYFDLLPRVVGELDPTRPYWPNSPWSGSAGVSSTHVPTGGPPPNDPDRGDRHTWEVKCEGYRTLVPRFCSEFGHQSPANMPTLAKVLRPEELAVGSKALDHRQRATGGMARHIDECLVSRFPASELREFGAWHARAQQVQAEAMRIGIDWLAANRPRCMGALVWQLNDAWPGMSWSLIDSDGTPKAAYFAVQEAFGRITP